METGYGSVPLRLESQYGAPFLRPYRSSPIPVMRMKRIFVKETLKNIPLLECEKAPWWSEATGPLREENQWRGGESGLRDKNLERGQQAVHWVKFMLGKPEDPR